MRTTNKEFKALVQAHILECLSEDYMNVHDQLEHVSEDFNRWYGAFEQKRTPNTPKAFSQFLMCLPSSLSVEFTSHGIHETLKAWFTACNTEYKDQPCDKEANLYLYLIYREFKALCKQENVQF